MTCGPYRPITLTAFRTRLSTLDVQTRVSPAPSLKRSMTIGVRLEGQLSHGAALKVSLEDPETGHVVVSQERVLKPLVEGRKSALGDIIGWSSLNVELWWPVGYGAQKQYKLEATLEDEDVSAFIFMEVIQV